MRRFIAIVVAIGLGSAGNHGAPRPARRRPAAGRRSPASDRRGPPPSARAAPTPDAETVSIRVYLKLRNAGAAEARAAAVSDPDNAEYGTYLTPAQVRDAFSPTAADVSDVSQLARRPRGCPSGTCRTTGCT